MWLPIAVRIVHEVWFSSHRFKVLLFALDYHVDVLTMPMWGPIWQRERERERNVIKKMPNISINGVTFSYQYSCKVTLSDKCILNIFISNIMDMLKQVGTHNHCFFICFYFLYFSQGFLQSHQEQDNEVYLY